MVFQDKDINKVILETLLDTKEIEITGIATLRSKLRPSKVDTKRDLITAPEQFIEISHSCKDAEVTIEEAVADYFQLSEEEATAVVKQWKSTTATMVSPNAYLLAIEGVGKVTYDIHRSLCFIPDETLYLALNPLQTSVIVHEIPEVKETTKPLKHPKDAAITSDEYNKEKLASQDDDTTHFWRQLSYLFAALLAIAIATAIYLYFFRKPEVHVKEIFIERSTPAPVVETPSDTIALDDTTTAAEVAAEEEKYYVIGGAFKEIARANATRDKFIEKGYKSARIIQRGTLNMVIICGYPTKKEADNFIINTPYTELGLSEPSWVLKIE